MTTFFESGNTVFKVESLLHQLNYILFYKKHVLVCFLLSTENLKGGYAYEVDKRREELCGLILVQSLLSYDITAFSKLSAFLIRYQEKGFARNGGQSTHRIVMLFFVIQLCAKI